MSADKVLFKMFVKGHVNYLFLNIARLIQGEIIGRHCEYIVRKLRKKKAFIVLHTETRYIQVSIHSRGSR